MFYKHDLYSWNMSQSSEPLIAFENQVALPGPASQGPNQGDESARERRGFNASDNLDLLLN